MRIETASQSPGGARRGVTTWCEVCQSRIGNQTLHAAWHARQSASPNGSASKAARQRALRARARALLQPSGAMRQAEMRPKARMLLAADDWLAYWRGRRALTQAQNRLSTLGFEATGDPDALRG